MYFVAENMSSNLSLRIFPSASGQLDSSWCTKMTFSSTACRGSRGATSAVRGEGRGNARGHYFEGCSSYEALPWSMMTLKELTALYPLPLPHLPSILDTPGAIRPKSTHPHTLDTPMREGTMRSMSTHRYVMVSLAPVSLLVVCSAESSVLNCMVVFFWVSCADEEGEGDGALMSGLEGRKVEHTAERGRTKPTMPLDAVLAEARIMLCLWQPSACTVHLASHPSVLCSHPPG